MKRHKEKQVKNERDVLAKHLTRNMVRLMYSFQDENNLYLAMEYCPGGDLRRLLQGIGYLSSEDARLYMAEMIISTHNLHQLNYIHRDLKPDNFLIDKTGHLKLADFGLCKDKTFSNMFSKIKPWNSPLFENNSEHSYSQTGTFIKISL